MAEKIKLNKQSSIEFMLMIKKKVNICHEKFKVEKN